MHVIATAGHVDHGKSTLVRALTGMEPDRWAEERRRGMTIDLGYAWTSLPSGRTLAFVDVPGHQRFICNMLAGLGPAPAVMMVVAADEGWREQSAEHLAAASALGIRHGLLVITRSDLADPAATVEQSRRRLAESSLATAETVVVSGANGAGLPDLRAALDRLVAGLPAPDVGERVRLWVDRAFTIRGAGPVVTGTLGAGTIRVGDQLELRGERVAVRGLQMLGEDHRAVSAVARVAVNLRSVPKQDVGRGDALLTPDRWWHTDSADVRLVPALLGPAGDALNPEMAADLPSELTMYMGTAAAPVHVRPLAGDIARLRLTRALPLQVGDRVILSDHTRWHLPMGAVVLDVDPVALRRRGAAIVRADALRSAMPVPGVRDQLRWRGAIRCSVAEAWGLPMGDLAGVRQAGDWLVEPATWDRWATQLAGAVDAQAFTHSQDPVLPMASAAAALQLPDPDLVAALAAAMGLHLARGGIRRPGRSPGMGAAGPALQEIETALRANPFAAPERGELARLGLTGRDLAVAVAVGRLIRLEADIVLLPDAPARALQILGRLPQPFTTSQARIALGSTRRVVIPLLEHLDRERVTTRVDENRRQVTN